MLLEWGAVVDDHTQRLGGRCWSAACPPERSCAERKESFADSAGKPQVGFPRGPCVAFAAGEPDDIEAPANVCARHIGSGARFAETSAAHKTAPAWRPEERAARGHPFHH